MEKDPPTRDSNRFLTCHFDRGSNKEEKLVAFCLSKVRFLLRDLLYLFYSPDPPTINSFC